MNKIAIVITAVITTIISVAGYLLWKRKKASNPILEAAGKTA